MSEHVTWPDAIAAIGCAWAAAWGFVQLIRALASLGSLSESPSETSKILEHYREQDREAQRAKKGKP